MDDLPRSRMRLRFARLAGAGEMSHLEQIREFRALAARSGLDCFPARHGGKQVPKMAFGPSLPSGCESRCEYADLYLAQRCAESVAAARLSASISGPFALLSVKRVPVLFPSIEASVSAAQYLAETDPGGVSRSSVDSFMAGKSAPLERTEPSGAVRMLDARPLVLSAELDEAAGALRLRLRLEPGKYIKPAEVLRLISGKDVPLKRLVREELFWLDSKGVLDII